MSETPSAFSVAHYVLLFIVSTLCTISVVWVLIAANNRETTIHSHILKTNTNTKKSCERAAADAITLLWQNSPQDVPEKYKIMENNYANRIVPVRTTGTCNGVKFICTMGSVRSKCDPCAKNSAQKRAMFQHISDTIDELCKNN
jgi:hypothetical protein